MNWEAIGAIGEFVGGLAVVLTLVYIAFQVRQSSKQIDQHSRALAASTYSAVAQGYNNWFALVIQDEAVASLWQRGIAGEALDSTEKLRFHSMAMMLFVAVENNFYQVQLGSMRQHTLEKGAQWVRILNSPGGSAWWKRQGRGEFSNAPEFVAAVEALVAVADSEDSDD